MKYYRQSNGYWSIAGLFIYLHKQDKWGRIRDNRLLLLVLFAVNDAKRMLIRTPDEVRMLGAVTHAMGQSVLCITCPIKLENTKMPKKKLVI